MYGSIPIAFLDGNGRTGRLVINLVLVLLGYAPAIIYKHDRSRYLQALRSADSGELGPLGEMLARAALDNLYRFIVPAGAGPIDSSHLPRSRPSTSPKERSASPRTEADFAPRR